MRSFLAAILVLIVPSTACADRDVPLTDEEYDDVAMSIGSSTLAGGELGAMADVLALATGRMPRGVALGADGAYHGARQGRDHDYTIACHDADDTLLPVCGADTDRAQATVAWAGGIDLPLITSASTREATWDFAEIASGTAMLDGSGALTYDTTQRIPERQLVSGYHLAYAAHYDAVAVELPTGRAIGGAIHYAVTVEHTRRHADETPTTRAFEVDAHVQFATGGGATITIDDRSYRVDAATGLVSRP